MARETLQRRPKPRRSLAEVVYQKLRTAVLTCEIAPGSEVSELDLANQLKVSKTPVREALARLANDGFVRAYPRRGYQILPLTISDMNDIFDVRLAVETGAVELACARITEAEIDALQALADSSFQPGGSRQSVVAVNREFHGLIAKATHSERMYQLVARYIDELERFFYLGATLRDISNETVEDHRRIVEALRARDVNAARKSIADHTEKTRRGLLLGLASDRSRIPVIV
jgi:DNA-binding GntR family transcriptional regulator